jgi:hypothetical protein
VDTDRPGREIDKEYRDVVEHLIASQGWAYQLPQGSGYPRLLPADRSQPSIKVRRPGTPEGAASTTGSLRFAVLAVTGRLGGLSGGLDLGQADVGKGTAVMAMTAWFTVHVQARPPRDDPHTVIDEAAADRLMDMLADYDGIVSGSDGRWEATVSLEEPDPVRAAAVAAALVESLATQAGMPSWPAVRVEAIREDVLAEENARPTLPGLVSTPEAAEILGVTPQRLRELATGNRGFPAPVYELKAGKLWLRDAIEAFAERWDRKPGRPDRAALIRQRVTSALLDAGITASSARLSVGQERIVILQLAPGGAPQARRRAAGKVVTALGSAGLGVTDQASHSAEDMAAYLADGGTAEVFELAGQPVNAR